MTPDRRLVVNADDFGLSPAVNAGVLRAHAEGIVTTASLMVRQPAAEHAVAGALAHPRLALGLHLDLGEWVRRDGGWAPAYEVVDTSDPAAVAAEFERQLERFRSLTGGEPSHLDSHQHVHREEPVRSILGVRAKELRIPLRHHGRVRYCGAFYGRDGEGAALPEAITPERLVRLVAELPAGATELCCHPAAAPEPAAGYGAERVRELESLCDRRVRAAVRQAGVRLCTFREALAPV